MGNYYFLLCSALISPQNLNAMPSFELHVERKACELCRGPPSRAGDRSTCKARRFVQHKEEKAKGRASCYFLNYLMGTEKRRAKLFFVVHSAKGERQVSQIAGKEIQTG